MPHSKNKVKITTQDDVNHLVREFSGKVLKEELLAPHFAGIDLEHHLPRMVAFWALILVDQEG